jgi:hypothetical protein
MSELSRETEALLERGRGGTPLTPAHRARLRGAILARATGAAVVATATSASAWTSLGAKIVGAALLVATVGGAGAAIGMRVSLPTPAPTPTATLANPVATDQGAPPASKSSTQAPGAISNVAGLRTATSVTAPTLTPVPASHATAASIPAPALITVPAPTRRETLAPIAAAPVCSAVPAQGALPASAPTPMLARDVRLLRDADLAVKGGDPERALALLDEHAAAFPRSDLEPERSAERVFALCRAGRIEEARHTASAFLGAHPTGPLAERVKGACREAPRE